MAMARKSKARGKQTVISLEKLKGPQSDSQAKTVKSIKEILGVSTLDVDNIGVQEDILSRITSLATLQQ